MLKTKKKKNKQKNPKNNNPQEFKNNYNYTNCNNYS